MTQGPDLEARRSGEDPESTPPFLSALTHLRTKPNQLHFCTKKREAPKNTSNLMHIHTLQLTHSFKHKHSNACMHAQSHPGRVTSNINIYTQRKQHTLLGTHSCILSPATDKHLVRPGHLGRVWANSAPGNPSALIPLSNSLFGNKPSLVQLPTMSVTLYTAPLPLIVSSQCFLVLCSTMPTLNRESNLLVLSLIGFLRGVENGKRKGEKRCW